MQKHSGRVGADHTFRTRGSLCNWQLLDGLGLRDRSRNDSGPARNSSMKILLTGGAGYVGSACLRWLLRHGHDPIAYDNLVEGNVAAVPDAPNRLIVGDIAETDHLAQVFLEHRIEAVMHFAALAWVPDSIADPEAYYRTNVQETKSVLDAMRTAGVR